MVSIKKKEMEAIYLLLSPCFLLTLSACVPTDGSLPWTASFALVLICLLALHILFSACSLTYAGSCNICIQISLRVLPTKGVSCFASSSIQVNVNDIGRCHLTIIQHWIIIISWSLYSISLLMGMHFVTCMWLLIGFVIVCPPKRRDVFYLQPDRRCLVELLFYLERIKKAQRIET